MCWGLVKVALAVVTKVDEGVVSDLSITMVVFLSLVKLYLLFVTKDLEFSYLLVTPHYPVHEPFSSSFEFH